MKRIAHTDLVFIKKEKKYGFVRYVEKEGRQLYIGVEDAYGKKSWHFLRELIRLPAVPPGAEVEPCPICFGKGKITKGVIMKGAACPSCKGKGFRS